MAWLLLLMSILISPAYGAVSRHAPVFSEVIPQLKIEATVWAATCNGVYAGDFIRINYQGQNIAVRIYGISTYGRKTKWGDKAAKYVEWRLLQKPIAIEPLGKTNEGYVIGRVFIAGVDVGRAMIAMGLGVWDRKAAPNDEPLAKTEAGAKQHKIGMWQ